MSKWMTVLALAAMLAACANAPSREARSQEPWNGGIWNSVLGYSGPANIMDGKP